MADFKSMVGNGSVVDHGNGIKTAILTDGAKLTVRPGSGAGGTGPATLDVIRPTAEKTVKFRY